MRRAACATEQCGPTPNAVRETTRRGRACSWVGEIAVSGKDEFSIFNVSTDHMPDDERVPLLREFYCRGVLKAEVEPRDGKSAAASFTSHVMPEAQLLIGGLCGARVI